MLATRRIWHRNEFVFRFNRRFYPMAGFATLLGLGMAQPAATYETIRSPLSDGTTTRRRGRATGQTMARRFEVQVIEGPRLRRVRTPDAASLREESS